jgi:hypothetical protein
MATQDNQISDKRRRLFKALSAAPAVATLGSGEALANSSSVQCVLYDMPLPSIKYYKDKDDPSLPSPLCTSLSESSPGNGCHAFLERNVWDPDITVSGGGGGNPALFWVGKFVVLTTTPGTFYWIDEDDGSSGLATVGLVTDPPADGITFDGTSVSFYDRNGNLIKTVAKTSTGLFVAIGGPDSTTNPTTWIAQTVWPEQPTLANNVLGGSCMTSFGSTSGFTLADS